MDELRKDPILDRWVAIAPQRASRPQMLRSEIAEPTTGACPFCEGSEHETPGEVFAVRDEGSATNGPGWQLRVVPNKFPALQPLADGDNCRSQCEVAAAAPATAVSELYRAEPARGAHEVIIESPRHIVRAGDLNEAAWHTILGAYRRRLDHWRHHSPLAAGLVFKNVGAASGASLPHIHSQLVALPRVPQLLADELRGSLDYFRRHARCAFCLLIELELADSRRVVVESEDYVAFCPYASRFPFETWILPKVHASEFESRTHPPAPGLAGMLRDVLRRFESIPEAACYNLIIHSSPFDSQDLSHYHWHLELTPRGTRLAGYELGSGYYINPTPPEEAARRLRQAKV